jgi:hypothetical protein
MIAPPTTKTKTTMVLTNRNVRPLITLLGTIALLAPFCIKLEKLPTTPAERIITRRLDIARDDSDPLAEATLSVISHANPPPAVAEDDHERVSKILSETRELIHNAKTLYKKNGREAAHEMVNAATAKFREAKEHMLMKHGSDGAALEKTESGLRSEERKVEANEETVRDDEDRALDVSRNMYETVSAPSRKEVTNCDFHAVVHNKLFWLTVLPS